ncbi:MAG: lysogenization regulator HflD [Gammaproteobacteria bacterium]|nr:MAG: lysogenization regulator HflD [Gammaproteobacteria bacterium]
MANSIEDQTIALAGVVKPLLLISRLAESEQIDILELEPCINAIFATNPGNTIDVYGTVDNLYEGLKLIAEDGLKKSDPVFVRHFLTVLQLESKVSKNNKLLGILATGIEKAKTQADYFEITHENVIANLADLYLNTISKLTPRILIKGDEQTLKNQKNVDIIRTLLLSAIRSAVLWRQNGGNKLKIAFGRKKYIETAKTLIRIN